MMSIMSGKGSIQEMENLHGKLTKVYVKAIDGLVEAIERSDEAQSEYNKNVEELKEAGETTDDLPRPHSFYIGKDELALLNSAQKFLKDNDVQMDITKGTNAKFIRDSIKKQIKDKTE